MKREELKTMIKNAIQDMDVEDQVILWREYCQLTNHADDEIFSMTDLEYMVDPVFVTSSNVELIQNMIREFSDFDFDAEYFQITIYGYESLRDYEVIEEIDLNAVVDAIIDDGLDYAGTELEDIDNLWDLIKNVED